MKAIWIPKFGPPGVLEVRETPDPEVGPGEVRVRAQAAGLNFAEVMARQGLYPDAPKPPMVVGYEVAGLVDQVGAGVDGVAEGDRVLALTRFGGHSDCVVVPSAQIFPAPDDLGFEEGAAIPVNYLTAYRMIHDIARLREGESVLVHAAAGGVGTAALQLLSQIKDIRIFGTASAGKHDHIRALGCHDPIDYRSLDYAKVIEEATGGRGVDVIFDPLGGKDWKKGYQLLRAGGRLVMFGFANMNRGGRRNLVHVIREFVKVPRFNPMKIMEDNRSIAGVHLGHLWHEAEELGGTMQKVLDLYGQGVVKPHIDRVTPFAEAASAHAALEGGKTRGKVVLTP